MVGETAGLIAGPVAPASVGGPRTRSQEPLSEQTRDGSATAREDDACSSHSFGERTSCGSGAP